MLIEFPADRVEYKYYYMSVMSKMITFLHSTDSQLTIDLSKTDFITPNILCDMLSLFKYIYLRKHASVDLFIGDNTKMGKYLYDSNFFNHSEVSTLFKNDYIHIKDSDTNQEENTNKICRISVPDYTRLTEEEKEKKQLPSNVDNELTQMVYDIFTTSKIHDGNSFGLNEKEVRVGFGEIIENAYKHSFNNIFNSCYYTFQYYKKTGWFTFGCSDVGIGLYEACQKKYTSKKEKKYPRIFDKDDFLDFLYDKHKKDLAAIIECVVYRIAQKGKADFGFPYIIRNLVMRNGGLLTIHSGNTMLEIDKSFVREYLVLNEDYVVGYDKDKLSELVQNTKKHYDAIGKGIIRIYGYDYPGVHISASFRGSQK